MFQKATHTILLLLLFSSFNILVQSTSSISDEEYSITPEQTGICNSDPAACTPHDPIKVDGNVDLKNQAQINGWDFGATLDGSKDFPFIISGYQLVGLNTDPLISISNVDLYLTIRYNRIDGANNSLTGISLAYTNNTRILYNNISNMYVDDSGSSQSFGISLIQSYYNRIIVNDIWGSTINNNYYFMGISLRNTAFTRIVRNNIHDVYTGIELVSTSVRNHLVDNNIYGCHYAGIDSNSGSDNNSFYDNYVYDCSKGFYIRGVRLNRVNNNKLSSNNYGIEFAYTGGMNSATNNTIVDSDNNGIVIYKANNTVLESNTIENTLWGYGIDIQNGEYSSMSWNNLINNNYFTSQINDDGTFTFINNNYFSESTSPDIEPDNFVDNPYIIDGSSNNYDSQPLVMPNYLNDFMVTYPYYGLVAYGQVQIEWIAAVDTYNHNYNYTIYYSSNGGFLWTRIADEVQDTNYLWDSTTVENGDHYVIMVISRGEHGAGLSRYSSRTFEVQNHELDPPEIVYPRSGDILSGGVNINWKLAIDSNSSHIIYYSLYMREITNTIWIPFFVDDELLSMDPSWYWDTTLTQDGQHSIKIVADDKHGIIREHIVDSFLVTNEDPPIGSEITVSVDPSTGSSEVGDTVKFNAKISTTFLHDMNGITFTVELIDSLGDTVIIDEIFDLPQQSTVYYGFEVLFDQIGHFNLNIVVYDDIGVPWSFQFDWEVKEKATESPPTTSSPTSQTNEPTDNDGSTTPDVPIPFSNIYAILMSLGLIGIIVRRKHLK